MKLRMLALIAACLSVTAFAQIDPTRTVVTINGEEVKGAEYYRRMEYLPGVGKQANGTLAEFPPGFLTIEQLITERLVMQLAKEKNLMPTDAEVQQEITWAVEENPKLLEDWLASGRNRTELEYQTKFSLAQFKILTQGITITDQQVEQFYKDNPTLFTLPKRVQLRVIAVTTDAEKSAVDADLKAKKPFADVAKTRSQDVSRSVGGDYGTTPMENLGAMVQDAINKRAADGTTDWISSNGTWIKFFVEKVVPEEKIPLDAKLKRRIRKQRMADNGNVKNDVKKMMSDMRARAKIDIKQKEFADAYKTFVESYLRGGG